MKKKATPKRSPLHDRPLRHAGQSLDEQIELLNERTLFHLMAAVLFIVLASVEWQRYFSKTNTTPWVATILTLLIVAYSSTRIWKNYRNIVTLKLGRDGEMIVAENLEILTQEGAVVLHDIVSDGFNLDHVICSLHGIFLVESKTRSKSARGNPTVVYDGKKILVDGKEPDRNPVEQATALSKWLEQTLLASTGKRFTVKPVIVFPGWFVEPNPKGVAVWVLNPKALPAFIQNEPITISDSDLHLAVFHLTRYIRTSS
jgi:hypothetical protein